MSFFLRLTADSNKDDSLAAACQSIRNGRNDIRVFQSDPSIFERIPGTPFAYWVTERAVNSFSKFPPFGCGSRRAWVGLQTNHDFQWLRLWWENDVFNPSTGLVPFFKGGRYSPYYSDIYLSVRWGNVGKEIKQWKISQLHQGIITENNSKCWNEKDYFSAGIAWPRRTNGLSFRVLPRQCIFADKGSCSIY